MTAIDLDAHKITAFLTPETLVGAFFYLIIFLAIAIIASRAFRIALHAAMTHKRNIDRTTTSFFQQIGSVMIWVVMLILYAHLIPVLRSMGTALLAGASVASVVVGLAAQGALANVVAGISITLYKPFRLGDTLQVTAPTGTDIGTVETISLGYTTLRAPSGHLLVLPNSIAASQVTIVLKTNSVPWPITITIRLSRNVDPDTACQLALSVARENAGDKSVVGCYLTKADASTLTFELRFLEPESPDRDSLRSKVVARLSQRFAEARIGASGTETPAFY